MNITITEQVFLTVALVDFIGIFISIGVTLYLSYTKMDLMLGCFKKFPAVINLSLLLGSGWWGRLYVMGGITSVLVFPIYTFVMEERLRAILRVFPLT